ncbi:helix-turn-helix transcriptional regulator [Ideonella paludis]|uniref:helix-turn-helix transcriptional regulator n=1 Tax=Ideonella paludis TaxID=1233411 RepID=UPI003633E76A
MRALPPLVVLPLHEVDGLGDALNLLFREAEQVRCGQRLVANRLFEVVLMQLLRWMIQHPQRLGLEVGLLCGLADPKLAAALVALHERPGEAWRVETMAELAHLSRSAFMTRFKAVLGESPAEYLTQWRLAIARQRLRQGEAIKRISDELGYANPSAFSRAFAQRSEPHPATG